MPGDYISPEAMVFNLYLSPPFAGTIVVIITPAKRHAKRREQSTASFIFALRRASFFTKGAIFHENNHVNHAIGY